VNCTLRFLYVTPALLLTAAPAFAHKLIVECRVQNDRVRVEAFHDDDTPAQQAKIIIADESKKIIAEGRCDERGLWSCPLPTPGKYTVRAESVGHTAKTDLEIPDKNAKNVASIGSDNPSGSLTASSNGSSPPARSSRDELTETPWLKLAAAFVVIAALCAGALYLRKRQLSSSPPLD
jgi:hypothetical protein